MKKRFEDLTKSGKCRAIQRIRSIAKGPMVHEFQQIPEEHSSLDFNDDHRYVTRNDI